MLQLEQGCWLILIIFMFYTVCKSLVGQAWLLRGSSSSTVSFTLGSKMRSLCSHADASSQGMSGICGEMISAAFSSIISWTLALPRKSELWGRRKKLKVMSRADRKPWVVKLSRKSGEGKIGKVTAIPPLCCSPPLPSSPFNNKSWEYGPELALLGNWPWHFRFSFVSRVGQQSKPGAWISSLTLPQPLLLQSAEWSCYV